MLNLPSVHISEDWSFFFSFYLVSFLGDNKEDWTLEADPVTARRQPNRETLLTETPTEHGKKTRKSKCNLEAATVQIERPQRRQRNVADPASARHSPSPASSYVLISQSWIRGRRDCETCYALAADRGHHRTQRAGLAPGRAPCAVPEQIKRRVTGSSTSFRSGHRLRKPDELNVRVSQSEHPTSSKAAAHASGTR